MRSQVTDLEKALIEFSINSTFNFSLHFKIRDGDLLYCYRKAWRLVIPLSAFHAKIDGYDKCVVLSVSTGKRKHCDLSRSDRDKLSTVDRSNEGDHDDADILVTLDCGHQERFWLMGLSDQEYIDRARRLKKAEEGVKDER